MEQAITETTRTATLTSFSSGKRSDICIVFEPDLPVSELKPLYPLLQEAMPDNDTWGKVDVLFGEVPHAPDPFTRLVITSDFGIGLALQAAGVVVQHLEQAGLVNSLFLQD